MGLDQLDKRYLNDDRQSISAAGRSGSRRSPPACPNRAMRSKTSSNPIMIQQGFIQRTPRGRVLTANAWKHLGLQSADGMSRQAQFRLTLEDD
jgi:Holliday junction resolvasome RuvABC ATP-dependent DNA helicase subunit